MQLSWSEPAKIAQALLNAYPETDRQLISLEDLRQMVLSLPNFKDEPLPPRLACLESVLWNWMRHVDNAGEGALQEKTGTS